jgi:lipopolysaccharide transport system ATP-binding protein
MTASEPIIEVDGLSKSYLIRHMRYSSFREAATETVKRGLHRLAHPFARNPSEGESREIFWALRDVSFTLQSGARLGIIGRNGAGKSTLLKLMSRITFPSEGRILLRGKTACLLEVGTGFHPELTGRENIFLNGVILGMSRSEIRAKFDEIVAFSGVEKFLDTPVKRYSSGMYVRLAFSVAAHLEPEILIVDEVLAVGDAMFQKKSLGKMREVSESSGRTVLFVSHNMNAVEQLCEEAVLLSQGRLTARSDDVRSVIRAYLGRAAGETVQACWCNSGNELDNPYFKPLRFFLCDEHHQPLDMPLDNSRDFYLRIEAEVMETEPTLEVGYMVFDEDNHPVYVSQMTDKTEDQWPRLSAGQNVLRSRIPARFLNEGEYRLELVAYLYSRQCILQETVNAPYLFFSIKGGLSNSPYWYRRRKGQVAPIMDWEKVQ